MVDGGIKRSLIYFSFINSRNRNSFEKEEFAGQRTNSALRLVNTIGLVSALYKVFCGLGGMIFKEIIVHITLYYTIVYQLPSLV